MRSRMAKKAGPPLYDVIRAGSTARPPTDSGGRESLRPTLAETSEPAVGTWLRPGRTVSVPAGYLFVTAAIVLLVVIGGYMVGYSRGKHDERLAFVDHLDPGLGDVGRVLPRDPLEIPPAREMVRRTDSAGLVPNKELRTPLPRDWDDVRSDPRVTGLWYFILVTTNEAGAVRLAEYCRERGVEAYAVRASRSRLWQVVALPGFESRTDAQATALRQQINRIGETWQRHERGATNLHDAYPERFGG
jgi:hypothetical protein